MVMTATQTLPAMCLVQASSRAWFGSKDFSVRELDGVPAFIHTLRTVLQTLPESAITIVAPEFDRNGDLQGILNQYQLGHLPIVFAHSASPLKRMVEATKDLDENAMVMRLNGQSVFVDPRSIRDMIAALEVSPVDCYTFPDDYPSQIMADFYRVGALRQALALLPQEDENHIYIKYFLKSRPEFTHATHPPVLYYTPEEIAVFKEKSRQIIPESNEVVPSKAIQSADKPNFLYELAIQYLEDHDPNLSKATVLDIACGHGYGSLAIAQHAGQVIGGDLNRELMEDLQKAYADKAPQVAFLTMDALATGLDENSIDHVVSMATIEHVDIPPYLAELNRVMKPGGYIFFSTPQNCHGATPFVYWHLREYSHEEIKAVVETTFDVVECIGVKQGRIMFPGDPIGQCSFVIAKSRKSL